MAHASLATLVKKHEVEHQPALVTLVLNTLESYHAGADVEDDLLYTKWFVKGTRLVCAATEKGLNLQNFGWTTAKFSEKDLQFFYNYADLGVINGESPEAWEKYGTKSVKNMCSHLFTDKAMFAKKLADLVEKTSQQIYWLDQGITDLENGIIMSHEFDHQHQASQLCLKGELQIALADCIQDSETKMKLLEQTFSDYETAWNRLGDLAAKDSYILGFKGFTAQKIADLIEDHSEKRKWLETAISERGKCACKLEHTDPSQASTLYGFKAQAEIKLASLVPTNIAKVLIEQAITDYSQAINLASSSNRLHEAHLYSFRADAARRRAELTHSSHQYLFWKKQEYQDNVLGATKSKPFNQEHSAITFVIAGRSAAEIYELDGTHLDEAIANYSAFVNYFNQRSPKKLLSMFNKITHDILPSLLRAKNPSKKDPHWKRQRRRTHKYRTGNF